MQKQKSIASIQELRLKMAEKFAALENGEISIGEAKAFTGMASVMVNACKIELGNNMYNGVTSAIDFLDSDYKAKELPPAKKGLTSEFFEHDKKGATV